eukprot:GHVT01070890.1.p1 GENE.GHVT01070890.1~~GHVT01070890.1.p1  ORF type:complete len:166 (-),score=23.78 GHVT01070890.1:260-757(-)
MKFSMPILGALAIAPILLSGQCYADPSSSVSGLGVSDTAPIVSATSAGPSQQKPGSDLSDLPSSAHDAMSTEESAKATVVTAAPAASKAVLRRSRSSSSKESKDNTTASHKTSPVHYHSIYVKSFIDQSWTKACSIIQSPTVRCSFTATTDTIRYQAGGNPEEKL